MFVSDTFVSTLVAENLVLRKTFSVDTGSDVKVDVLPLYEYQLKKFQVRFHNTCSNAFSRSETCRVQKLKDVHLLLLCHGIVDLLGGPKSHCAAGGNSGPCG